MKSYIIILTSCLLLISCEKDEHEEDAPTSHNETIHRAYFKGNVTDSLTGQPITGYYFKYGGTYVPYASHDSLEDGTYLLSVGWFYGKFSWPKPEFVDVRVFQHHPDSILWSTVFDGDLLVEGDTITLDFQVNL
jgi:hypothetical protein